MHHCPACKSEDIHRSRSKSRWEVWRKEITGKRTYRCHACGWRGWGSDLGPTAEDIAREADRARAVEPPNLKGTGLAREDRAVEVNLDELDSRQAIPDKPRQA